MKRIAVAVLSVVVACGGPGRSRIVQPRAAEPQLPTTASAASFRDQPPPIGPEPVFFPPKLEETRLKNGIRILSAKLGGGSVTIDLVFRGTAGFFPAAGGTGAVTHALFGGTPTHDSDAIRRAFEEAFAEWSTNAGPDEVTLSLRAVRSDKLGAAIDMLADVVQHASLEASQLTFQVRPLVESAHRWKDDATLVAIHSLEQALYGVDHPFAQPYAAGFEANGKLDRPTALRIYQSIFQPAAATFIVVGAVDDELLARITKAYEGWHGSTSPPVPVVPPPTARSHPRIIVVDRPGTQARVVFGALGPDRQAKDWPALLLAHEVLGGRANSRLPRVLDDSQGITWGARTHLYNHRRASLLFLDASTLAARSRDLLAEADRQFGDLRTHEVSVSELEENKVMYLRAMPKWFETTKSIADTFEAIPAYDLPIDAFGQLFAAVHSVDPSDVQKLAAQYFAPDKLCGVVVGDWSALKAPLTSLGWGRIEIRDEVGKVLRIE